MQDSFKILQLSEIILFLLNLKNEKASSTYTSNFFCMFQE